MIKAPLGPIEIADIELIIRNPQGIKEDLKGNERITVSFKL